MKSIIDTMKNYEDIFRDTLKVNNPALLKTGALGALVNIFSNIKYDTAIYYNKLLRELNPATATEFNSLLFHSSILNYNITFGLPAELTINFIIPEFQVRTSELVTYEINKDTQFRDNSGLEYTLEEDVKIFINNSVVTAKRYSDSEINELEVSRVRNPLNTSQFMYMVEYAGLKQYAREFQITNIPDYNVGESYTFSINIENLSNIYEINAWIKREAHLKEKLFVDDLYRISSENIKYFSDLKEMKIKYNKFNASQFDDNLYLKITDNQLIFTIGDGINGRKLNPGDQIVIEAKLTKGQAGNVATSEINLENILISSEDAGGYKSSNRTNLKVLSLTGGVNGRSIEDIDYIKSEMLKKASTRSNIVSINDFEVMYTQDDGVPFIDPKFFNSQNHLFIYNVIRDTKRKIIPTNTFNIEESLFKQELFFPTRTYNNVELVSPFYFKKNFNHYTANMVNPSIKIELTTNSSIDKLLKLQNNIGVFINYDYFERKSRVEIKNFNPLYTYIVKTNQFDIELSVHNQFSQVINQRFLDEYCLLNEKLIVQEVVIQDNGINIITYQGVGSYFQLIPKQEHFYYTELSQLDSTKETRHILHIPFLSLEYVKLSNPKTLFTKLDRFFRVDRDKKDISFNVAVTQSFYNTIGIDPKYSKYIIDRNNNGELLTTKNIIMLNILIDKHLYSFSEYQGLEELEFDIKDIVYQILKKSEGFETEFYETTIEKELSNKFDLIKNVDVLSPRVFSTRQALDIYKGMDDDMGISDGLTMYDLVNFVPPYFYFDFDSINIKITTI